LPCRQQSDTFAPVPAPESERLSRKAADALRNAIADAGGNEVFLLGELRNDGAVDSVRVLARGNRQSVPALVSIPRPGEVVLHNHPSGNLVPSDADVQVASMLGNEGVGFYVVDNQAERVYVVVEPQRQRQSKRLDAAEAAHRLAPGGTVAGKLEGYEHRPEQLHMLAAVATAFNDDAVLTVEAGTGTGKSLAYLLPAIAWSIANKERVIVSTHTINLQEQLVRKDLPFLIQRVGYDCVVALVKGRGNYLCQRKAAQARSQGARLIEDDLQRELNEILAWAARTKDGSLGDLAVRPRLEVWEQVVSENDNCLRARCPHYSTCFFYTARRAAAKADIVVVNHHLLMADVALRHETDSYTQNAVLPPAKRVIIDEAHHLEDVATSYFGSRLSYLALERVFGRLQSTRDAGRGSLPTLLLALESLREPQDKFVAKGAVDWIERQLLPKRGSLATDAEQCFTEMLTALEFLLGRGPEPGTDQKIRVVPELRDQPFWKDLVKRLTTLAESLGAYAASFVTLLERLESLDPESAPQVLSLGTDVRAMQSRIAAFAAGLLSFVAEDESTCRWLEIRHRARSGTSLTLCTAPISVAPLLRDALFEPFSTAVLTSATLAVDRRFAYLHEHIGLDRLSIPERVDTLLIDSPFDFSRQALLAVPEDLPEPTHPSYEEATHDVVRNVIDITGGGTFVLFTSYGALNRAAEALAPFIAARGLTLLRQGQLNRQLLVERFAADGRAVLFATDSFWEGVDVRGSALRCVVITRLPFRVPTEPIEQARVEAIDRSGGNAFADHTVPQAVIKLKQGFGRLIRSRTDWGAVVLLDSRVVHKSYGRRFLDSLPPAARAVVPRAQLYQRLTDFFAQRSRDDASVQ
jgi:ATP-dependent DNA helicase DinG